MPDTCCEFECGVPIDVHSGYVSCWADHVTDYMIYFVAPIHDQSALMWGTWVSPDWE